ncbi:MAG: DUF4328 domain-containing protein [Nakamurella sp.]
MPSVWRSAAPVTPARTVAAPVRDLRSVVVLARATAVVGVIAAASEAFRYLLMVRGRTAVLPVDQVRWSDALVLSSGWAVVLMALATAFALIPAIGRTDAWARQRLVLRPTRSPARRLLWLLVPGVNLYGAGAVVAEIDATLRMPLPVVPVRPAPDRMRWRAGRLPDLGRPVRTDVVALDPDPGAAGKQVPTDPPAPVHRAPGRLIGWWWAAWSLSGLLAGAAAAWSLHPGSLQSRANLVELHVVIDLLAAAVALLTALVARSWVGLMDPPAVEWPVGWTPAPPARPIQIPIPTSDQAIGRAPSPRPTTESFNATSPLVTTQSTE